MEALYTKVSNCLNCNAEFEKNKPWQKYCCTKCNNTAQRRKRQVLINELKLEAGCAKCGYNDNAAALQFNHIDPSTKAFNIGEMKSLAIDVILEEVSKCEVLCANCHAIHTQENHYSRLPKT